MTRCHDRRGAEQSFDALLEALTERVVERVLERLDHHARTASDRAWYTQRDSPLGRRQFLEAARTGAFPSTKRGKLVLARRDDVDRWLLDARRTPSPSARDAVEGELSDEALLAANGLMLAPAHAARKR